MNLIAFDTETYGLERTAMMFGFSWAYRLNGELVSNYSDLREGGITTTIKLLDQRPDTVWCMHNAKFDMLRLKLAGITLTKPIIDTKVLVKLADNSRVSYSLEACGAAIGFKKDSTVEKWIEENHAYTVVYSESPGRAQRFKQKHFDQVPLDIIEHYAKRDAEVTLRLAEIYLDKVPEDVWRSEAELTQTLFAMEEKGLLVDPTVVDEAIELTTKLQSSKRTQFSMLTGAEFVNSAKVLQPIFDEHSIPYLTTSKGNASFDKESLDLSDHPISECIKEIRNADQYVQTYYSAFKQHARFDGRVHASFQQAGPRTFRLSCSEPNLQNVPKEECERPVYVRSCFVPTPGTVFVFIDYRQMEFRMLMDYAGEVDVISRINQGEDVHQIVAEEVGITRSQAKTVQFGLLYGMGPESLAKLLKCSNTEATAFRNKYFRRYPRVSKFLQGVKAEAKRKGFVSTWDGVKLFNPKERGYSILNHLIQGGCARVMRRAMPRVDLALPGRLVLQVHDELIFEMTPDELSESIPKALEIMENAYIPFNGVRLDCDVQYSEKSWGFPDRLNFERGRFSAKGADQVAQAPQLLGV